MAITTFNHVSANAVLGEMREALKAIADKHGISINLKRPKFDSHTMTVGLQGVVTQDSAGNAIDPFKQDFERYAGMLGVDASWYGKTFRDRSAVLKVSGILPNRPVNCIQVTNIHTSKTYVCSPGFVRRHLG